MEKVAKLFPEKIKPDVVAINCRNERLFIGRFSTEIIYSRFQVCEVQILHQKMITLDVACNVPTLWSQYPDFLDYEEGAK